MPAQFGTPGRRTRLDGANPIMHARLLFELKTFLEPWFRSNWFPLLLFSLHVAVSYTMYCSEVRLVGLGLGHQSIFGLGCRLGRGRSLSWAKLPLFFHRVNKPVVSFVDCRFLGSHKGRRWSSHYISFSWIVGYCCCLRRGGGGGEKKLKSRSIEEVRPSIPGKHAHVHTYS